MASAGAPRFIPDAEIDGSIQKWADRTEMKYLRAFFNVRPRYENIIVKKDGELYGPFAGYKAEEERSTAGYIVWPKAAELGPESQPDEFIFEALWEGALSRTATRGRPLHLVDAIVYTYLKSKKVNSRGLCLVVMDSLIGSPDTQYMDLPADFAEHRSSL
jgi:hypothetical protein